jgi:hypothetical protein
VPLFLERFVLTVLAAVLIGVILLNPFKLDWRQRVSLAVAVVAFAYFVGHTVHKMNRAPSQFTAPPESTQGKPRPEEAVPKSAPTAPDRPTHITGPATSNGEGSVANTGDGNTINTHTGADKARKKDNP